LSDSGHTLEAVMDSFIRSSAHTAPQDCINAQWAPLAVHSVPRPHRSW